MLHAVEWGTTVVRKAVICYKQEHKQDHEKDKQDHDQMEHSIQDAGGFQQQDQEERNKKVNMKGAGWESHLCNNKGT